MGEISTINEYGPYVPLVLRLKKFKTYSYITGISKFSKPTFISISSKRDIYDFFITDEDLDKSNKKFIIEK